MQYAGAMGDARPDSVPSELWATFVALAKPRRLGARELLWEPGDERNDESFLVLDGLVRLYHPSRNGHAVTLLLVGPGGLLGHHPELQHHPYTTGAEAMCAGRVLPLAADRVTRWLQERDDTGRAFVRWLRSTVNRQLAETYTRLQLEHDVAAVRVAHVLLVLDRHALLDRMARQDLADLANLTLETTVRVISRFVRDGLLANSRLATLSLDERLALAALLEPYEPPELPYG